MGPGIEPFNPGSSKPARTPQFPLYDLAQGPQTDDTQSPTMDKMEKPPALHVKPSHIAPQQPAQPKRVDPLKAVEKKLI